MSAYGTTAIFYDKFSFSAMVHVLPIYLVIIDLYSYCPLSGVLLILVVPVDFREVLQVRFLLGTEIRSGQYPVVLYKYSLAVPHCPSQ